MNEYQVMLNTPRRQKDGKLLRAGAVVSVSEDVARILIAKGHARLADGEELPELPIVKPINQKAGEPKPVVQPAKPAKPKKRAAPKSAAKATK